MDEYLDTLSIEILRLYRKKPDSNNYSLSQLDAITNRGQYALCTTIALLRKQNYLIIDPTYAALHPEEIKLLGNTISADTPLRITKEGIAALEKSDLAEKRYKINLTRDRVTLAVSIATLVVSVATLIVTIIAMLK